jgi:hypothetical protein
MPDNEIKRFYWSNQIEIKQIDSILDSLKYRTNYSYVGIYPNFEKNKDSKISKLSIGISSNRLVYLFSSMDSRLFNRDSMIYNENERKIFIENELLLKKLVKLSLKLNKNIEESESEIFIAFGPTKKLFNDSWDGICIVKNGKKTYDENSKNQIDTNTYICTSSLTN